MAAWWKLLAALGPFAAKNLPKLWPLLLESKNREKVMQAVNDLASQSPRKRLRARAELTAELATGIAEDAGDDLTTAHKAEDWARRAKDIGRLLEMPVQGRQQRRDHRRLVRGQLDGLQGEMNDHLSRHPSGEPPSLPE